ncbi:MAG: hypothetical protein RLY56_302 [Pseudomonadota bacterium]|jgi:hypothetical protein
MTLGFKYFLRRRATLACCAVATIPLECISGDGTLQHPDRTADGIEFDLDPNG